MTRNIPSNAFRFVEGLYINETNLTIANRSVTKWELYAEEGYCFYDKTIPENYDEEGELKTESERVYYRYTIMPKDEAYVTENIVAVPFVEGYEIVN